MKNEKNPASCSYCGMAATTRDHVPPRCLLDEPLPKNLITVPACIRCNNDFSKDEEYFLNVLVEIGTSHSLVERKRSEGSIHRARLRRPNLYERIKKSFELGDNGRIYITPEYGRIEKLFQKIALGLYWHKYRLWLPLEQFNCCALYTFNIEEQRPNDIFLMTYTEQFRPKKWTVIQPSSFSYIVVRNWKTNRRLMIINIHNTIWACIELPRSSKKRKVGHLTNQLKLF